MICKETNRNKQQNERTENQRKKQSAIKGPYTLEYELNKFRSYQRTFFPPMRSITCFFCHKPGHIAAYCKTKKIQSNQQRMYKMKRLPQENKWRGQPFTRYIIDSMATIFHATNLDINILNVNCVQKGEINSIHQLNLT